jgi:hypothetical protein
LIAKNAKTNPLMAIEKTKRSKIPSDPKDLFFWFPFIWRGRG